MAEDNHVMIDEVTVTASGSNPLAMITPRPAGLLTMGNDGHIRFADENGIIDNRPSNELHENTYIEDEDSNGTLNFNLPNYGYAQYINDMSAWQKQIRDINGEIGWFYFKVFFNFNTGYGLLGGLTKRNGTLQLKQVNCAIKYLDSISDQYAHCKIKDRMLALYKFGNTLKHISLDVPWYFRGISGFSDLKYPYTSEFQKERKICINCSEEAIDMRLGTLMDLYKYACYDSINCREIIPANLRKFEMTVIFMHVPLKYHHEPSFILGSHDAELNSGKGVSMKGSSDFSRLASFKMFTFQNCEFDIESLGTYYTDPISNESPFSLGKHQLVIKYDRVFEHRMDEWNEFLLGDDGFYYNNEQPSNTYEDMRINPAKNSIHRKTLESITNGYDFGTTDTLVSYSEYFLNSVWAKTPSGRGGYDGKWRSLINQWNSDTEGVRNRWNGLRSSWSNLRSQFGG